MSRADKIEEKIVRGAIIGGGIWAGIALIAKWRRDAEKADPTSGIGTARNGRKKYYVYAGYYENYISSKPMPSPYILRRTFNNINSAINYAESIEDAVIYCNNVKYDLPDYLYEALNENDEFFRY